MRRQDRPTHEMLTSSYSNNKTLLHWPLPRREFFRWLLATLSLLGGLYTASANAASQRPVFAWLDLHSGQFQKTPPDAPLPSGCPGSLMKLVSGALLLETHRMSPAERLECRGQIDRHGKRYRCQKAHGSLGLGEAIGHSCNVFFAQAADRLSAREVLEAAKAWGLLQRLPTGPFAETQLYCLGLSPQLQPNLKQLLLLSAQIATRGHVTGYPGPTLSSRTWDVLSAGMRLAAQEGTARALDPKDTLHLAVKTGTTPHGHTFQSWVIGYFPADAPRYAFCLRAPRGTSQDTAIPWARQALRSKRWP